MRFFSLTVNIFLPLLIISSLTLLGCQTAPVPTSTPIVFVTVTPTPAPPTPVPIMTIAPLPTVANTISPTQVMSDAGNRLGQIMVLEYHRIAPQEIRYQRTPANFRRDLQKLYERGYYPVNMTELVRGLPDLPPGKKPIALTFDDSDISHFELLADGSIASDSAVGILSEFHQQHGDEWPLRATFFVLADDRNGGFRMFGQADLAQTKLAHLVEAGFEVGSHTVSHADLAVATAERIAWELAISQQVIQSLVPEYTVHTLSVPFGAFPLNREVLKQGQWEETSYQYQASVAAWGGPTFSPYHPDFDPYFITRIEVDDTSLDYWLNYFDENPMEYYRE